jgi:hypothetical protein
LEGQRITRENKFGVMMERARMGRCCIVPCALPPGDVRGEKILAVAFARCYRCRNMSCSVDVVEYCMRWAMKTYVVGKKGQGARLFK